MKNEKTLIKDWAYKAAAFYAGYFTFLPLINPETGHWKNVLTSLFVTAVTIIGVYLFTGKTPKR